MGSQIPAPRPQLTAKRGGVELPEQLRNMGKGASKGPSRPPGPNLIGKIPERPPNPTAIIGQGKGMDPLTNNLSPVVRPAGPGGKGGSRPSSKKGSSKSQESDEDDVSKDSK